MLDAINLARKGVWYIDEFVHLNSLYYNRNWYDSLPNEKASRLAPRNQISRRLIITTTCLICSERQCSLFWIPQLSCDSTNTWGFLCRLYLWIHGDTLITSSPDFASSFPVIPYYSDYSLRWCHLLGDVIGRNFGKGTSHHCFFHSLHSFRLLFPIFINFAQKWNWCKKPFPIEYWYFLINKTSTWERALD
jgi:hypothetical protein